MPLGQLPGRLASAALCFGASDPSPAKKPRDLDPDPLRSPLIRAPRAGVVLGVDVGAKVDQALRRVGVAGDGRGVERRLTSGRGAEDERRIVPLLKGLQEWNQRRGACTSNWILLEGFTDLLCFFGGILGVHEV